MNSLLRKIFSQKRIIPARTHGLKNPQFSRNALSAIQKLQAQGYEAYIVGGAIRDLLLGIQPKDFDIATDATSQQVKHLFGRQARIIGRRFRIVHLSYYARAGSARTREVLEVTTFRGEDPKNAKSSDKAKPQRLAADSNCYGTAAEDAHRRDFTMNALLYDPRSGNIIDYVNGYRDTQKKTIKTIGAAKERMAEDPVRILRAMRLSAKLGLNIEPQTTRYFKVHAALLAEIPNSRLFDEIIKVIQSGASARIFNHWREHSVARFIFPKLNEDNPFFFSILAEGDRRFSEDRAVSVSFILAALFWSETAYLWHQKRHTGLSPVAAMEDALAETTVFRNNRVIPHRLIALVKKLYFLLAAMDEKPNKRRMQYILHHEYLDRALAFTSLRQDTGAAQTASWWAQYLHADKQEKARMVNLATPKKAYRRAKRDKTKKAAKVKKAAE